VFLKVTDSTIESHRQQAFHQFRRDDSDLGAGAHETLNLSERHLTTANDQTWLPSEPHKDG